MFDWIDEVIPIFLFGWKDNDENYYLIVFQIIINNTLINIC
jgi:hypothetical protein